MSLLNDNNVNSTGKSFDEAVALIYAIVGTRIVLGILEEQIVEWQDKEKQ